MDADWNITPAEMLSQAGIAFKMSGRWLSVKVCIFCRGGEHKDASTMAVHAEDGNFSCLRSSCGAAGNFWKLIEALGREPRDYRGEHPAYDQKPKKTKKRGFIYGR